MKCKEIFEKILLRITNFLAELNWKEIWDPHKLAESFLRGKSLIMLWILWKMSLGLLLYVVFLLMHFLGQATTWLLHVMNLL